MKVRQVASWVVYRTVLKGASAGVNVVCEAGEWDALERLQPGVHTLVRDGIASEAEAERLARGTSGDTKPRNGSRPAPAPLVP
jgi:hypothetical protein